MLASGHSGLDIKHTVLLCSTVQYTKAQLLEEMHIHDNICQTGKLTYVIIHAKACLHL